MKEYDLIAFLGGAFFTIVFWGFINSLSRGYDIFRDPFFCTFAAVFLIFIFDRYGLFRPRGIG